MSVESKFENKYKNYKEEFTELLDEVVEGSLPVLPEMRAELDEVYTQAAKADEYEAKAKAFDRIVEERNRIGKVMHNKEYPQDFTDEAFWNIDDIINDAESGEYDA